MTAVMKSTMQNGSASRTPSGLRIRTRTAEARPRIAAGAMKSATPIQLE